MIETQTVQKNVSNISNKNVYYHKKLQHKLDNKNVNVSILYPHQHLHCHFFF